MRFDKVLDNLAATGNLRQIPGEVPGCLDFSTNDYLGINADSELRAEFMADATNRTLPLSSTASRLLAADQRQYAALEELLSGLYRRATLMYNSGYHANTGIVPALADSRTLILADKLVHASIIDGIILSRARFSRFRHNDFEQLERLVAEAPEQFDTILVIVESIYSMDGDRTDLDRLADIKRHNPRVMLYVDEAHAVGVTGRCGLGMCVDRPEVDVIVGTLGKALASAGAYVATSVTIREYLLNKSRSFIFSTALPPMQAAWSRFVIGRMVTMDDRRDHLAGLARQLSAGLGNDTAKASHITPCILGDAHRVVEVSRKMLACDSIKVLPIRHPTVAAGTERLRISLSAAHSADDVCRLINSIHTHVCN